MWHEYCALGDNPSPQFQYYNYDFIFNIHTVSNADQHYSCTQHAYNRMQPAYDHNTFVMQAAIRS